MAEVRQFNDWTTVYPYVDPDGFIGDMTLGEYIDINGGEDAMVDDPDVVRAALREHGRFLGGGGAQPWYALSVDKVDGFPFPESQEGHGAA